MNKLIAITLALLGLVMFGCGKNDSSTTTATEPLPASLIVRAEPAGAMDIVAAKKSAADGQPIVIRGRVGGQKDPFASNRAIMTLADLSLTTCDKSPMDKCTTPWDSCCEAADVVAAKSLSVQVLGPDGRPIKAGLSGVGGIAPMKQVVVAGVARTSAAGDTLLIDAREIYVVP